MIVLDIHLDPTLTLFGPLVLSWHGLFSVVGIFAAVVLGVRLARTHVPEQHLYNIATWGVIGGIIGARLFHVVDQWDFYARDPLQIFAVWTGGVAITGGIVGGIIGGTIPIIRDRLPQGFLYDAAAPAIPLAMAIGRIGDVINGEHHATECGSVGVCVEYTHPETLGQASVFPPGDPRLAEGPVHLAVGYEMVLDLAIVALVLWLRPRMVGRPGEGRLMWLFIAIYGTGRFFLSYIRADPVWLFGMLQAQLVALVMAIVGALALLLLTLRARRQAGTQAPPPA